MTLNGVMVVSLRYFSEFVYLPGVLRKSSRSLSHLLMSSCKIRAAVLSKTCCAVLNRFKMEIRKFCSHTVNFRVENYALRNDFVDVRRMAHRR